jgi:hypothetical protein
MSDGTLTKRAPIALPALPSQFHRAALALPKQVRDALPQIVTAYQAADALAQAEAMSQYGRRIHADIESVNAITHAKVLLQAKLGELLVREPAGRPKNGKTKIGKRGLPISKPTISTYRKIADHADQIDLYAEKVKAANAAVPDESPEAIELSSVGFLRFVGSDSTLCTKHNNNVIEWYTPEKYIEATRSVMGSIDLDPASNPHAQKLVKAKTFWTAKDDGLAEGKAWAGTVFLNPPYKMPSVRDFVFRLCDKVECGDVSQAILLTNDNTDTQWWQRAATLAKAICFHAGRVSFYNAAGEWSAPTNGQTFFYFGSRGKTFCKLFAEYGLCLSQ